MPPATPASHSDMPPATPVSHPPHYMMQMPSVAPPVAAPHVASPADFMQMQRTLQQQTLRMERLHEAERQLVLYENESLHKRPN